MKLEAKNVLPFGFGALVVYVGHGLFLALLWSLPESHYLVLTFQAALFAAAATFGALAGFLASCRYKYLSRGRAFLCGALFASIITAVPLILPSPFPFQPSNYFLGAFAVSNGMFRPAYV